MTSSTSTHARPEAACGQILELVILRRTNEVRRRISTDEIPFLTLVCVPLMLYRSWLKLAAITIAAALLLVSIHVWSADRRDRTQLAAELASTKQLLSAAEARQKDRDVQLAQTLAELAAEKRAVLTPAQIVRELPKAIPLPASITLLPTPPGGAPATSADGQASDRIAPNAVIPASDLKPLYDFALDCKACQAKLTVAQNDLSDEHQKTVALTKERDAALRVARGGSAWRRVGRAAKWFILGAAAGALAARSAH